PLLVVVHLDRRVEAAHLGEARDGLRDPAARDRARGLEGLGERHREPEPGQRIRGPRRAEGHGASSATRAVLPATTRRTRRNSSGRAGATPTSAVITPSSRALAGLRVSSIFTKNASSVVLPANAPPAKRSASSRTRSRRSAIHVAGEFGSK